LASIVIGRWLVLRREVSRAGWWTFASIVGLVVAGGLVIAVYEIPEHGGVEKAMGDVGGNMGIAVLFAVFGASLGTVQWLFLRRRVSQAGWWVLASAVGFANVLNPGSVGRGEMQILDEWYRGETEFDPSLVRPIRAMAWKGMKQD